MKKQNVKRFILYLLVGMFLIYAGIYWGYGHYGIRTNTFNLWIKPFIIFTVAFSITRIYILLRRKK